MKNPGRSEPIRKLPKRPRTMRDQILLTRQHLPKSPPTDLKDRIKPKTMSTTLTIRNTTLKNTRKSERLATRLTKPNNRLHNRIPILHTLHQLQNTLIPDGTLHIRRIRTRKPIQRPDKDARIIHHNRPTKTLRSPPSTTRGNHLKLISLHLRILTLNLRESDTPLPKNRPSLLDLTTIPSHKDDIHNKNTSNTHKRHTQPYQPFHPK